MRTNRAVTLLFRTGLSLAAVVLTCAFAVAQDTTVQGLIIARSGANMVLQTADTPKLVVVLSPDTDVKEVEGKLGMRKKELGITALIPGLPVKVKGSTNAQNQLVATSVEFKASALGTAQQIQAGVNPTDQQLDAAQQEIKTNQAQIEDNAAATQANAAKIAANKQAIIQTNKRFSELDQYEDKGDVTVYFGNGSVAVEPQYKTQLLELAGKASGIPGYMIQVKGYASSTGSAALNQKLSAERADAILNYLEQTGKVPLTNIMAPGAMGTSDQVAADTTTEGQAENRRVVVKILVNKGIAGS